MTQTTMFEAVNRQGTYTTKYEDAVKKFGTNDLLPLWVADMDLASPSCVQEALQQRAKHPIYGYTVYPERYFDAIHAWMQKRFDWEIDKKWIVPCYGVVPSMTFAIKAYSNEGDGIVIQSPIYPPFASSVKRKKRVLHDNVLVEKNSRYEIDFEDLEAKLKVSKMFLLCSPHNPTGRVWDEDELEKIIDLCLKYDVVIVSDEIHADIVYEKKHHSIACFEKIKTQSVVLTAPSKTFNVAGLNTSYAIIPDDKLRRRFSVMQDKSGITNGNPFGIEALMAAYEEGDVWLEALKQHLADNIAYVTDFLKMNTLPIDTMKVEATFLMWLDCRKMGLTQEQLTHFFIHDAKLGLNDGKSFGEAGEGFMRLNVGTSREVLEEAMQRVLNAYKGKI